MRADFVLQHVTSEETQERHTVVEVKTVVDTDYDPVLHASPAEVDTDPLTGDDTMHKPKKRKVPKNGQRVMYFSEERPYRRSGIFPWGRRGQLGPEGRPTRQLQPYPCYTK